MIYEIQYKDDFLTGSSLIIRVPEKEIDYNALHTIQRDCPEFIVPFHHKRDDDFIELVYKIGTRCKLQYFSGEMAPKEYTELWQSLLRPLLDCRDWFMDPCSFVMSSDHLYYDKNKNAISYIYIPSVKTKLNYEGFYKMTVDVSKMIMVSDAALENKVLKAIIKDFNPIEFLQILTDHIPEPVVASEKSIQVAPVQPSLNEHMRIVEQEVQDQFVPNDIFVDKTDDEKSESVTSQKTSDFDDDIVIDIQAGAKSKADRKKKERESGGYKIFSGKSKRKAATKPISLEDDKVEPQYSTAPLSIQTPPAVPEYIEMIDITEHETMSESPSLRYVGYAQLPPAIMIVINEGEMFTIGRFDAAIGKKQSSFEFEKKTKAVSRRHAVIERDTDGYKIIDLSSSAGTFVNNKKLPPNTPHNLEKGCRVSFGNSGADYVWEAS